VAFFLVLGSAVGAFVGAHASRKVPERALKMLVGVLLAVVGLKELHDVVLGGSALAGSEAGPFGPAHYLLITASGLAIGILSGLTGVGGGVFIVPTLVLGFGLAQRVAQGPRCLQFCRRPRSGPSHIIATAMLMSERLGGLLSPVCPQL
jgi:uncharacterized membrane protein YfcA